MYISSLPIAGSLLGLFYLFHAASLAKADCPSYLEPGVKESEPSLGSMDTCDYHSPDDNPFFSRVDLVEDMANPVVTYRYCYYPCLDEIKVSQWSTRWTYETEKVCRSTYFTKRIKDGENTRVFEDTAYDSNPNVMNSEREPHAAIAFSDEGTVCFHHLERDKNESCTNCCGITCLGLSKEDETHVLYYQNAKGNCWFVEMTFSKNGSDSNGNGKSDREKISTQRTAYLAFLLSATILINFWS